MSQTTGSIPADADLIAATNAAATVGLFFTVAELREAMSPVGYLTPADEVLTTAVQTALATANAAIPASTLGQALGPVQADANNKVPLANLPSSVLGSSHYLGTWNALLNLPLIQSGVAPAVSAPVGGYYIVSIGGTPTIDGNSVWHAGDWIIWNGSTWSDITGQVNPVSSVAGLQGSVTTSQLANALVGSSALTASGGLLNVVLGTAANTAAAGNDSRITGAAQNANVYTFLNNVAAISSYNGNAPSIRTAGYYAAGDGGGAFYTQTNTGAPAIADGAGRDWYLQDINGAEVNILHFGAKPDGATDMQPAWAAADAYAAANNKGVFVPSAPTGGAWRLITPMITTARHLRFESPYAPGTGGGTVVRFAPTITTDLVAAITLTGNAVVAENVSVIGPSVMPTLANVMTSGWVIAASSFQGTISGTGTTMNVAGGLTGIPAVGQQVSGAGMSSVATITAVSGAVLTISPAQPLISTAQTFTTCALPNYNAFKAGPVGIAVTAQAVLRSCYTGGVKVGILLNNSAGHVYFYDCSAGGFFGYYILDNSFDFAWFGGGAGGVWAGFAFGTANLVGPYGGVTGNWFRVQMPLQAAYHIYQFNESGYAGLTLGVTGSFYGCSFESCNEAAIQTLSTSTNNIHLVGCVQQWGSTPLPNTITPVPQKNLFSLGTIQSFVTSTDFTDGAGSWRASTLGAGAYPQYSLSAALGPRAKDSIDLRFLDSNLNVTQYGAQGRWNTNYRSIENAQKGDFGVKRDILPCANLLKNPEQNIGGNGLSTAGGNWVVSNATVTIGQFSSFPELSAISIPQSVQEVLGTNPMVTKVVQTGTGNTIKIAPAVSPSGVGLNTPIWMRFWELQLSSPQLLNYLLGSGTNASFLYAQSQTPNAGVITQVLGVNETLSMVGDTTGIFTGLTIPLGTITTVYFLGVMVGTGEIGPYNPLSTPYAGNGLAVGDGSVTDSQNAVHIISGTGAPTSTTQPAGTLYLRKDGTTTGLYQYVNGAWITYT